MVAVTRDFVTWPFLAELYIAFAKRYAPCSRLGYVLHPRIMYEPVGG